MPRRTRLGIGAEGRISLEYILRSYDLRKKELKMTDAGERAGGHTQIFIPLIRLAETQLVSILRRIVFRDDN